LGGKEGSHLHDQCGSRDIGKGVPGGGARPVENVGSVPGHQHIFRMIVSMAQRLAIGKLCQPGEYGLACCGWDESGVLDQLDQLLAL
jgi:hypothetical protein